MDGPRFSVLDVVEISGEAKLVGLAGRRGVIAQVRRYPDGTYRYGIGSRDEDVGGLYDEDALAPTGEHESIDFFRVPGPFLEREIVRVAAEYNDQRIAGRRGVIDGSYAEGEHGLLLGVWVEELGESFVVQPEFLTATGDRAPLPPRRRTAASSRVSGSGEILGHDSYEIVDDINQRL